MTRNERIEAAALDLRKKAQMTSYSSMYAEIAALSEALALPPDPVPRRLTAEDILLSPSWPPSARQAYSVADFLNASIFGEQK